MPVTISIKNAPDELVARLKSQAKKHRRSLQGEVLAILEGAATPPSGRTLREVFEEVKQLGLRTPAEAADIIRADRDANHGH
jgi:antitoxin FitA